MPDRDRPILSTALSLHDIHRLTGWRAITAICKEYASISFVHAPASKVPR